MEWHGYLTNGTMDPLDMEISITYDDILQDLHPLVMTSHCPETITHHINGKRNRREAAVPGISGRSLLLGAPEICFVQSFQHHLGQIPSEI